jgi:hypothetical protein
MQINVPGSVLNEIEKSVSWPDRWKFDNDSYEPSDAGLLQTGRERVRLPTCCSILFDFGVALTQSLRLIAYIAAMDERRAIGAALDVASPFRSPEHFTQVADGSHRPCQNIWRKRKRIGVEFD